jgi:hypothetical protein
MKPPKSPKPKNSRIKALTIRQPWAELILRGRKPLELRSWSTKYRGPLAIHAAIKVDTGAARRLGLNPEQLTTGAFVGVAVVVDSRPYSRDDALLLKKRRAGFGWLPYTFAWVLKTPRRISPVKGRGQLSLFKVSKDVERKITRALAVRPKRTI